MNNEESDNKSQYLEEYYQLCRKLNKFPTKREIIHYVSQPYRFETLFGSVSKVKEAALELYPDLELSAVPAQLVYADLEDYKLSLEKKQQKKNNEELIKGVSLLDYVETFSEKVFSGRIDVKPFKTNTKSVDRILNLMLSDLHFGSDIDGEETGSLSYGKVEEARRFAKVISECCGYKLDKRDSCELNVFLLGDLIQGVLGHDPRDGCELSEQFCRAIHLLGQGLAVLAENFKKVTVLCATGNHDRNISRHVGRAVHSKFDSFATMIYYSLQKMFINTPNIKFIIPKTPFVFAEVFDQRIFACHGDTVLGVGSVGKSINIGNIEKQINKINASLTDDKEYSAFLVGHLHHGTLSMMPNGAILLVNPGLPPSDSFGISLGSLESNSGQLLFESVKGMSVADVRFIRVNKETDLDKSLDSIIKPWGSYNE